MWLGRRVKVSQWLWVKDLQDADLPNTVWKCLIYSMFSTQCSNLTTATQKDTTIWTAASYLNQLIHINNRDNNVVQVFNLPYMEMFQNSTM